MTKKKQAAPDTGAASSYHEEPKIQAINALAQASTDSDRHLADFIKRLSGIGTVDYPLVSVVIPFRKDKAKGDELLYAVRAWAKNYPAARIVVIGDALPWFSEELIYIPFEDSHENAQVNTTAKIMLAIASDHVTEDFILSCDDIYPVTPLDLTDILLLRCNPTPLAERVTKGGHFRKNLERTVKALKGIGIKNPYDFDTNTPYYYSKETLASIIELYDAGGEEAKLLPSLYFNTLYPHVIPFKIDPVRGQYVGRVVNEQGNDKALERAFYERKYINHDDNCYKRCEPFLKAKFSEKCKFEK